MQLQIKKDFGITTQKLLNESCIYNFSNIASYDNMTYFG